MPSKIVGRNYLSRPKLQKLYCWNVEIFMDLITYSLWDLS